MTFFGRVAFLQGADVNARDHEYYNQTALHCASQFNVSSEEKSRCEQKNFGFIGILPSVADQYAFGVLMWMGGCEG